MSAKHASANEAATGTGRRVDILLGATVLALCAAAIAGLSWTRPTRSALVLSYTQNGFVSYSAPTSADSAYGTGGVKTGQSVESTVVPSLEVSYRYDAQSAVPLTLEGTEQLVATVGDGLGATRTLALQQGPSRFTGTDFLASGTLSLGQLASDVAALSQIAGREAPPTYSVSVGPSVSARGLLGGHPISVQFDSPVKLVYTPGSGGGSALLAPANAAQGPAGLSASAGGSLQIPGGKQASLLLGLPVGIGRIASLVVLLVTSSLIFVVGRRLLADATSKDEQIRIATRYGSSLVEVAALPGRPQLVVVEMTSFEGLMQVAKRLECPILHRGGPVDTYGVVDNGTMYRFSPAGALETGRMTNGVDSHPKVRIHAVMGSGLAP